MEVIMSLMSIPKILELPWYVSIPGLTLAALALWSSIWNLITLRFAAAITRLVFVFLILVILTQNGQDIVRYIDRFMFWIRSSI